MKNVKDMHKVEFGIIKEKEIRQATVNAVVDTGAWTMVINEAIREKLGLEVIRTDTATLADGKSSICDIVGPLEIGWKDRSVVCEAILLPDTEEPLLGAIPLEAMDLTVNPRREEVVGAHGDQILHRVY